MPTLKTISNQCPNLNTIYNAVKIAQGDLTTASLTEMGAIVGKNLNFFENFIIKLLQFNNYVY